MIKYSITEGRKSLGEIINIVKYQQKLIGIGKGKKVDVLVIPYKDMENTEDIPVTQINSESDSFSFLANEPDIYSLDDLRKRYV